MKSKYLLFTLAFTVLSTAKATIIPKDRLADYKNAVILGTNDHISCRFDESWWYTRNLKDLIGDAKEGYVNDDQIQPIVTLTFLGEGAENSEFDLSITTNSSFTEVTKVDFFRRDLISNYRNLGTIAKPNLIKSKSWKTTLVGSCK
ncbi:MAG: hypothetical protein ACXVCP_20340 [Bdellovibrio sp.]